MSTQPLSLSLKGEKTWPLVLDALVFRAWSRWCT